MTYPCLNRPAPYDDLIEYRSPNVSVIKEALDMCKRCPIRAACWAQNADETWVKVLRRGRPVEPVWTCLECRRSLMRQKDWDALPVQSRPRRTHAPALGDGDLCVTCNARLRRQGREPRSNWNRGPQVIARWTQMQQRGLTRREAADLMGMTMRALDKAIQRHNQSGMPVRVERKAS